MGRRVVATSVAVVTVAVLAVAWFWARPWWQERSLVAAVEDVGAVTQVTRLPEDDCGHCLGVELADDASVAELDEAGESVDDLLREHEVGGREWSAFALVDGVPVRGRDRAIEGVHVATARVVGAVEGIQLSDRSSGGVVDGVVPGAADLVPATAAALEALDRAGLGGGDADDGRRLTLGVDGTSTQLLSAPRGAGEVAPVLRRVEALLDDSGLAFEPSYQAGSNVAMRVDDGVECVLGLTADDAEQARRAAELWSAGAGGCTLSTVVGEGDDAYRVSLQDGAGADEDTALARRLRRTGLDVSGVRADPLRVSASLPDAAVMERLVRLTSDWPDDARISLLSQGRPLGEWTVRRLAADGPLASALADAGFGVGTGADGDLVVLTGGDAALTSGPMRDRLAAVLSRYASATPRTVAVTTDGMVGSLVLEITRGVRPEVVREPTFRDGYWGTAEQQAGIDAFLDGFSAP